MTLLNSVKKTFVHCTIAQLLQPKHVYVRDITYVTTISILTCTCIYHRKESENHDYSPYIIYFCFNFLVTKPCTLICMKIELYFPTKLNPYL